MYISNYSSLSLRKFCTQCMEKNIHSKVNIYLGYTINIACKYNQYLPTVRITATKVQNFKIKLNPRAALYRIKLEIEFPF